MLSRLLHRVGDGSSKRARVEVPFRSIAPEPDDMWSKSSAAGLDVAIGQSGTRTQALRLGEGTSQHVLIAGNTGSGKSTLLHVLITNAAMWYSPEELQFYLIDFKKGVEFKSYAALELPHAQAIAIESDRGFGLSVLERVDEVLRDRGTEMRRHGVQSVAAYRKLDGVEPMPRIVVIIDEFQEFFVEDDKVAQDAALLLDRIVRQGRAFGIHMLLGTQTLGGAYSLARSTLGQMSVRIALQCSEQDSYLILSDDNTAARLLSRPGEAIYNDAAGAVEGNSPFQVVWLSEEDRDECIGEVAAAQAERQCIDGGPAFVFEGNMPADIARNLELNELIAADASESRSAVSVWLGTPNAIKGPTRTLLRRQGGDNLIIVGQQDKTALALCVVALRALAAQKRPDDARFVILDGSPSDSPDHGRLAATMASCEHDVQDIAYNKVPEAVAELAAEQKRRQDADESRAPSVFVVVYGLQRYRKLRNEDDYSFSEGDTPDQQFAELLREGPDVGIHLLIWCDTVNNLNRTLTRKTLREFDHKVLFQMSANDSMALIDSTAAGNLGMHRAVFHNEQEGIEETFNPYALPDPDWPASG
jgi:DNA polymerase III delta prime subunit